MKINRYLVGTIVLVVGIILFIINHKYDGIIMRLYGYASKLPQFIAIAAAFVTLIFPSLTRDSDLTNFNVANIANNVNNANYNIINDYLNFGKTVDNSKNNYNKNKSKNSNNSNNNITRNVSESVKKHIAAQQQWRCADCLSLLPATYEVDHIKPLYQGGNNSMANLQALCRNCHGKKTLLDRISNNFK
jgi:predicted restriction endonuclease